MQILAALFRRRDCKQEVELTTQAPTTNHMLTPVNEQPQLTYPFYLHTRAPIKHI
jgi:hypothetical protein